MTEFDAESIARPNILADSAFVALDVSCCGESLSAVTEGVCVQHP